MSVYTKVDVDGARSWAVIEGPNTNGIVEEWKADGWGEVTGWQRVRWEIFNNKRFTRFELFLTLVIAAILWSLTHSL